MSESLPPLSDREQQNQFLGQANEYLERTTIHNDLAETFGTSHYNRDDVAEYVQGLQGMATLADRPEPAHQTTRIPVSATGEVTNHELNISEHLPGYHDPHTGEDTMPNLTHPHDIVEARAAALRTTDTDGRPSPDMNVLGNTIYDSERYKVNLLRDSLEASREHLEGMNETRKYLGLLLAEAGTMLHEDEVGRDQQAIDTIEDYIDDHYHPEIAEAAKRDGVSYDDARRSYIDRLVRLAQYEKGLDARRQGAGEPEPEPTPEPEPEPEPEPDEPDEPDEPEPDEPEPEESEESEEPEPDEAESDEPEPDEAEPEPEPEPEPWDPGASRPPVLGPDDGWHIPAGASRAPVEPVVPESYYAERPQVRPGLHKRVARRLRGGVERIRQAVTGDVSESYAQQQFDQRRPVLIGEDADPYIEDELSRPAQAAVHTTERSRRRGPRERGLPGVAKRLLRRGRVSDSVADDERMPMPEARTDRRRTTDPGEFSPRPRRIYEDDGYDAFGGGILGGRGPRNPYDIGDGEY